jgi:hypothetical protein
LKKKIIVETEQSPSHTWLWDIVSISNDAEQLDICACDGLQNSNRLEIGSWIRKAEAEKLKRKNKNIQFMHRVVFND